MKIKICLTFLLSSITFSLFSCSCMMEIMSVKKILNYPLVFDGKVINKETVKEIPTKEPSPFPQSFQMDYFKYTFKIIKKIKGDYQQNLVTIYSPTQGGTCGVNYDIGDRLYIYSYKNEGNFHTGLCSNNIYKKQGKRAYKKVLRSFKKAKGNKEWFGEDGHKIGQGKIMGKVAQGNWKFFHSDGSLESEGNYLNGQKHGIWNYYYNSERSANTLKSLDEKQLTKVKDKNHILYKLEEFDQGTVVKRERFF